MTGTPARAATVSATPLAWPTVIAVRAFTWNRTRSTTITDGRSSSTSASSSTWSAARRSGQLVARGRAHDAAGDRPQRSSPHAGSPRSRTATDRGRSRAGARWAGRTGSSGIRTWVRAYGRPGGRSRMASLPAVPPCPPAYLPARLLGGSPDDDHDDDHQHDDRGHQPLADRAAGGLDQVDRLGLGVVDLADPGPIRRPIR